MGDCVSADAGPRGADAGTASKQQILRAVVAAGSAGGTTNVRFESNRAASQESSSHRHADERVDRRRSAGDGHGRAGADGVGVARTPPPPDRTALVLGGTTVPTPDQAYLDVVRDHFIGPTHPGETIEYVAVTTPEEAWPFTGSSASCWLVSGPQSVCGSRWPGVAGRAVVETLRAVRPHLRPVGAGRGHRPGGGDGRAPQRGSGDLRLLAGRGRRELEKRKLAEQYPEGTDAPDIDFVLAVTPMCPTAALPPGSPASTSRSST